MGNKLNQITENQHFVPRFYLKKFTNCNNEVEILDCKQEKILSPRGTKGICYESFFYGLETGQLDETSQQIEQMFHQMEDWIAKNLDTIISKILNNEQILDNEKWLIAFLMSLIWIRGPVLRRQINDMHERVMKKINLFRFSHPNINEWFDRIDKKRKQITAPEQRDRIKKMMVEGKYSLEFNNYHHLAMFDSFKGFANLFFGQHWIIFISKSKKFITSDNPIVVILPKRKGFYGPGFLERIHHFALTPEIFIVTKYPISDSGKKFKRKTLFNENADHVLYLNLSVYDKASEYVYASERQSLNDILIMVKHYHEMQKNFS